MNKILIIKVSALGDVLRTTPLLRVLNGEIFWLTSENAKDMLPEGSRFLYKVITKDEIEDIKNINFDLILSLEENLELANIIKEMKYKKLIGVFCKKEKLSYTTGSASWFDMSLISRFGKEKADQLKFKNRKSYQELIFEILGKKFKGEEYLIKKSWIDKNISKKHSNIVMIEKRAGKTWPMKRWPYYHIVAKFLRKNGYKVYFLKQRKNLKEYFNDINRCSILISGDTLAMHIGLALKKRIFTLFTCTSPWEIYDYGRLVKIINPFLKEAFYRRDYDRKLVSGIKPKNVIEILKKELKI